MNWNAVVVKIKYNDASDSVSSLAKVTNIGIGPFLPST